MVRIKIAAGLLLCSLIKSSVGLAQWRDAAPAGYYERKAEGWYWHQLLPQPPAHLDEEQATPDGASAAPAVTPLSPAWLRENLPRLRDRAIEAPTALNVRAYLYAQRYALDSAERFATMAQRIVMSDPQLDQNVRRPISTYGSQVVSDAARESIVRVARAIAQMAGVWFFYRSDCSFCKAQVPVLERLSKRLDLVVLPVALDGFPLPEGNFARFVTNRGHAEELGITATPTLYLVRRPNQFVLLSEGLVTDEALMQRMVLAAHEAGWISDDDFNSTRESRPLKATGLIEAAVLSDDELLDPEKLIKLLRLSTIDPTLDDLLSRNDNASHSTKADSISR